MKPPSKSDRGAESRSGAAATSSPSAWAELAQSDILTICARLTLIYLLLLRHGSWDAYAIVVAIAAPALLNRRLACNRYVWGAIAILTVARVVTHWMAIENHIYLATYWCLALAICLWLPDSMRVLSRNARLLVGLPFVFAMLWKGVLSSDFVDGTFFRVTLLADGRFRSLADLLAGLTGDAAHRNLLAIQQMTGAHVAPVGLMLEEPDGARILAAIMTYCTLIVESAVAICFLAPMGTLFSRWRHVVLITFCATTYLIAPVTGFGWLLVIMGLAQTSVEQWRLRLAYFATFAVIAIAAIPWGFDRPGSRPPQLGAADAIADGEMQNGN